MEFVLAHRRLRAHSRRLVAQLRVYRAAAGDAVHGHRLGGVDPDPATRSESVERTVLTLRADGTCVSPGARWDPGAWSWWFGAWLERAGGKRAASDSVDIPGPRRLH